MWVPNLVFLVLLVTPTAPSGIPQYIRGQWIITEENPHYEDADGLPAEENIWPESPPEDVRAATEDQNLLSTLQPHDSEEKDPSQGQESSVWKIVLVVAVLLVSVVGLLSAAYYMCMWRGGRIHYKLHTQGYA